VIDRGFVGKQFPPFSVRFPETLSRDLDTLFTSAGAIAPPAKAPPMDWPALLTLHGTAGLITVWDPMGVDPMDMRLVSEQFIHFRSPAFGEELTGRVTVQELSEHIEPERGIQEQVDLSVSFWDSSGERIALYRCSFRIPLAVMVTGSGRKG